MIKKNKKSFLHILLLSFLLLIILLIFFSISFYKNYNEKPVFYNFLVDENNFSYNSSYVSSYGPILPFGAEVRDEFGNSQLSPTYEFYLNDKSTVLSPLNGYVLDVGFQPENDDYYIWISPKKNSAWIVEIDHVKNVTIKKGDYIHSGKKLGLVGSWYKGIVGRTELMIIKKEIGGYYTYYCPYLFFSKNLKQKYSVIIKNTLKNFNSNSYNNNPKKMVLPGCFYYVLKDGGYKNRENLKIVK